MSRGPIVIIGGMGPQASVRFHELLVAKSTLHHSGQGDEYPFLVHFSLPVADFISDPARAGMALQMLDQLDGTIRQLQPDSITLACNTAHLLAGQSALLGQPEFVSMIDTVAQRLTQDGVRRIGILASPTTVRTGLYAAVLQRHGIATVRPTAQQLATLERVIRQVIAGTAGPPDAAKLHAVAGALQAQGADAILLGCTELPLAFDRTRSTTPVYDCLDIYASAIIARYYHTTISNISRKEPT